METGYLRSTGHQGILRVCAGVPSEAGSLHVQWGGGVQEELAQGPLLALADEPLDMKMALSATDCCSLGS